MFYRIVKKEDRRGFLININNITYVQMQKSSVEIYMIGDKDYASFVFTEEEWCSKEVMGI